jgi:hypothetical protein
MSWPVRLVGIVGALLVAAGAAQAAPRQDLPACRRDRESGACALEYQRYLLTLYGLESLEAHRDAGNQVRRAFYVDGHGQDVIAISFVRSKGHDPVVRIDRPRRTGDATVEPLQAPIPEEVWEATLARSNLFDRKLVPLPESVSGDIIVCVHGWVYTVEAADPAISRDRPAELRRKTGNSCDDDLLESYAAEIYRAAVPLIEPCRRKWGSGPSLLAACFMLKGDRLAAAAVANRLERFDSLETNRFRALESSDGRTIEGLFDHDAAIDWNGESNGTVDPAPFLVSKLIGLEQSAFYFERIEGEGADRVRVTGGLERSRKVAGRDSLTEIAAIDQQWKRDGDAFYIESMRIGPFVPLE